MKKSAAVKNKLEKMLISGNFEQLQLWEKSDQWKKLQRDEREVLAKIFTKKGGVCRIL